MQDGQLQFFDQYDQPIGQSLSVMKTETAIERTRGLLGRPALQDYQGLWIIPCNSVHTFGMAYAIDVIYLDKHMKIRKISANLKKRRLSACLSASSALELPAGSASQLRLQTAQQARWLTDV